MKNSIAVIGQGFVGGHLQLRSRSMDLMSLHTTRQASRQRVERTPRQKWLALWGRICDVAGRFVRRKRKELCQGLLCVPSNSDVRGWFCGFEHC